MDKTRECYDHALISKLKHELLQYRELRLKIFKGYYNPDDPFEVYFRNNSWSCQSIYRKLYKVIEVEKRKKRED